MNGLEWLEGYGGHEAYHHQQIDELIALVSEEGRLGQIGFSGAARLWQACSVIGIEDK